MYCVSTARAALLVNLVEIRTSCKFTNIMAKERSVSGTYDDMIVCQHKATLKESIKALELLPSKISEVRAGVYKLQHVHAALQQNTAFEYEEKLGDVISYLQQVQGKSDKRNELFVRTAAQLGNGETVPVINNKRPMEAINSRESMLGERRIVSTDKSDLVNPGGNYGQ